MTSLIAAIDQPDPSSPLYSAKLPNFPSQRHRHCRPHTYALRILPKLLHTRSHYCVLHICAYFQSAHTCMPQMQCRHNSTSLQFWCTHTYVCQQIISMKLWNTFRAYNACFTTILTYDDEIPPQRSLRPNKFLQNEGRALHCNWCRPTLHTSATIAVNWGTRLFSLWVLALLLKSFKDWYHRWTGQEPEYVVLKRNMSLTKCSDVFWKDQRRKLLVA